MKIVYFTICSANYLCYARTLAQSVFFHEPDVEFICFLMDEVLDRFEVDDLGFRVVQTRDIGCPNHFDMAARYSIMEMNTAIKPFCFEWLINEYAADRAAYIDPDILLTSPLDELSDAFDDGAAIVLTPHSLTPLDDGKDPDDIRLMRTGAYNLGFCAVQKSDATMRFLAWWGKHLINDCIVDLEGGLFVDQKFCDLVPCYFENTHVLRHPGYNVAYWNLNGRVVTLGAEGRWSCNGEALRFFHFSGVVPGNNNIFSKHQDRFTVFDIGEVRNLLDYYLDELEKNDCIGEVRLSELHYAYSTLKDGTLLTDFMRRVYRRVRAPSPRSYDDAFAVDLAPYLMLAEGVVQAPNVPVTRLMHEIWKAREDLQSAFPLSSENGPANLLHWFIETASHDLAIPSDIIEETKALCISDLKKEGGIVPITNKSRNSRDLLGRHLYPWAEQRRIDPDLSNNLTMIGYFNTENGLGSAVRANYKAAKEAGIRVDAFTLPCAGFDSKIEFTDLSKKSMPDSDCMILHVNADQVDSIACNFDPRALKGRHRIGYWAWELPTLPIEWVSAFDHVDEIWVPSAFTQESVMARTSKPVLVVPHPIARKDRPRRSIAELRAAFGLPSDRMVFLSAFDLNSYINRKNPFAALEAFRLAFPKISADGPILVIKLHGRGHRNKDWLQLMNEVAGNPNVQLIDRVLSSDEIDDLQWACDAFVSLHRSEGFGLWIAECMAKARPCLVTGFSGNMDYCNDDNCVLINYDAINVGAEEYPYGEGQRWAAPDLRDAVDAMRLLYETPSLCQRLGRNAQLRMRERYSYSAVGAAIRRRLYQARAEVIDLPTVGIAV